jgi:hypothetical protein
MKTRCLSVLLRTLLPSESIGFGAVKGQAVSFVLNLQHSPNAVRKFVR